MLNNDPNGALSPEEFESLQEVGRGGMMQKRIPDDHARKLVGMRLINELLGGLGITASGRARIARGR